MSRDNLTKEEWEKIEKEAEEILKIVNAEF